MKSTVAQKKPVPGPDLSSGQHREPEEPLAESEAVGSTDDIPRNSTFPFFDPGDIDEDELEQFLDEQRADWDHACQLRAMSSPCWRQMEEACLQLVSWSRNKIKRKTSAQGCTGTDNDESASS